jgi:nucleoside-diphosphate-sugar epimerase
MKPVARSLPRRFRQTRVLIVGCGDVGLRAANLFGWRLRLYGTTRNAERLPVIRAAHAVPQKLDWTNLQQARRVAAVAQYVIVLAPPPNQGNNDPGSNALAKALAWAGAKSAGARVRAVSYISTTGVYGDCAGRVIDELEPLKPNTDRARRRVAAETLWHQFCKKRGVRLAVLRAPGIYAQDRLPLERLRAATPALQASEDVYTNHIHAQDLAQVSLAAVLRVKGRRNFNATDGAHLKMGEYFDKIAKHFGLPLPPRLSYADLQAQVSPMMLSFMSESRRVDGRRLLKQLHLRLRYPTVDSTLLNL